MNKLSLINGNMGYLTRVEVEMNKNSKTPIIVREVGVDTGKYLLMTPHLIDGRDDEGFICDGTADYSLFVRQDLYGEPFVRNLEKMAGKDPKIGFEALIQTRKGESFVEEDMHQELDTITYNPNFAECEKWLDLLSQYQRTP